MLAARANDGRLPPGTPYPFPLGTEAGEWRVSPPLTAVEPAWWVGDVTPFMLPSAAMVRTKGPYPLTSKRYARDFNEVKEIGSLDEHDEDRRPDDGGDLLAGAAAPDLRQPDA